MRRNGEGRCKMGLGIPLWILIPLAIGLGVVYFKLDKLVKQKREREAEEAEDEKT